MYVRWKSIYNNESVVIPLRETEMLNSISPSGIREEKINVMHGSIATKSIVGIKTWDTLTYRNVLPEADLVFTYRKGALTYQWTKLDSTDNSGKWKSAIDKLLASYLVGTDRNVEERANASAIPCDVVYSTLIGGSNVDGVSRVINLSDSIVLLIGQTQSPNLPMVGNPWSSQHLGDTGSISGTDAYILCLNTKNNRLMYSTYFGGSDLDGVSAAAFRDGKIYIASSTWSDDLPVSQNAWQKQYRGGGDGYVAVLDSTGSKLLFCSYLGGSGIENLHDMEIDDQGNIVLIGLSDSFNFPTTIHALQRTYGGGGDDIFVSVFNADASKLISSTYVGGSGWDEGYSVELTAKGNILIAGFTNSTDFPITNDALYSQRVRYDEGCVIILSQDCRNLIYSTYIAWNAHESAQEALLDSNGVLTVFGITSSPDLPVTANAYQAHKGEMPDYNPNIYDFYVLKYHLESRMIVSCTYLGGSGSEKYPEVLIARTDCTIIGGSGWSEDYPITCGSVQAKSGIVYSSHVSILDGALENMMFSMTYGGNDHNALGSAILHGEILSLVGFTQSDKFPSTVDAYKSELTGLSDGYLTQINLSTVLTDTHSTPSLPSEIRLRQNYPNPFATQTSIPFQLSMPGHVRLQILDMLGREITTLVDGYRFAGLQEAVFTSNGIPSGLYLYRLSMDGHVQSRLMVVEQ
jgi:hypothetical protein